MSEELIEVDGKWYDGELNEVSPPAYACEGVRLSEGQEIPVGTDILIPKGVRWKSTGSVGDGTAKRDTRIKVQTSSGRFTSDVTWAGSGGYWKWCPKVECFYFPE